MALAACCEPSYAYQKLIRLHEALCGRRPGGDEMKIGDFLSWQTGPRVDQRSGAKPVEASAQARSSPAEPATKVSLAGIPEAEMTPKVRDAVLKLMEEAQALRAGLKDAEAKIASLEQLADHDPMLDVLNRRAFLREVDRTISMIDRYGMSASLVFLDLNGLKVINDGKGHGAGDAALTHVANVLSTNTRQTDIVGRLGGDEFGVLLTQADKAIAMQKADELAALVQAAPVEWNAEMFPVSVSIGVAPISKGATVNQAMEEADTAMYGAKRAGTITR